MSRLAASTASAALDRDRRILGSPLAPREDFPVGERQDRNAATKRLYYGWIMVPLAMAVMVCSAPGQTYGFMSFNSSLRESLRLSQTEFSGIYLLATLCAAIPLSYLGRLTDRFGLKRSMLTSIAAMAGVCLRLAAPPIVG